MKNKLLFGIVACITAVVMGTITLNVNFSTKSSDLSNIALTNVEALAMSEGDCGCYGPKIPTYDGSSTYCECNNTTCCMDNHGCN